MVVRLDSSDAFVILIDKTDYNVASMVAKCIEAERNDVPMYMIAVDGADLNPLMNFPWRKNGIFVYKNINELQKIWGKIKSDLRYMRAVGR